MIRRAIGTTLAGLCALTGPLASGAFAATAGAALTLSASSAHPGTAFKVSPAGSFGCPAEDGVQTVQLSFTDHRGVKRAIGSATTDEDGAWADAVAQLPVAGLDDEGKWSDAAVAAGVGTVSASCFTGADTDAEDGTGDDETVDDPSVDDPTGDDGDDGDDDTGDDETGDDDGTGDGEDPGTDPEAPTLTYTYAGTTFTATGSAPKLALSATIIKPGASVTVTPAEGCAAGASVVKVALVSLSSTDDADDDGDGDSGEADGTDPGDDDDSGDSTDDNSGLPATSVTTSTTGTWSATLALPADTATGDYAVTADCTTTNAVTSSYDASPIALGTALIGPAICGARTVSVALNGTYTGDLAGKGDLTLPTKLGLTGNGPWKVQLRSATTGLTLAARTVACAKSQYELDVTKPRLSDSPKPRLQVRVCNTGRAPVTAVLLVLKDKKFQKVDKEILDPSECVWLAGPKLDKGDVAKAQVQIDAPGKGSDDVTESFTLKRPKH